MTKDGMNKEEQAILLGMTHMLNRDLCEVFVCPEEGCDECPFYAVARKQEAFLQAIADMPVRKE